MYLATHYLPNRNRNPNPNPLGNGWQRHCEVSGACGAFPQTVDRQDSPVATAYSEVPPALAVEGDPPRARCRWDPPPPTLAGPPSRWRSWPPSRPGPASPARVLQEKRERVSRSISANFKIKRNCVLAFFAMAMEWPHGSKRGMPWQGRSIIRAVPPLPVSI